MLLPRPPAVCPPGPRGLPIFGSLLELGRDPLALLLDLGRNYGDVAFTHIGLTPTYLLSQPEQIEEVLLGKHRECVKDFGTRELIPVVGRGLLTSEGDFWRRQRKLAAPPLQPRRIASYADTMVACAERTSAALRDGEERDIHVDMMALTLEIVGKTLLGVDTRGDSERIARILDVAMLYLEHQLRSWRAFLPRWVPTADRLAFRAAMRELDEVLARMIARGRAAGEDADDLLARLAQARDEDGKTMSDEQLRDEAVTMLLAGHETTALALSFAVYLLAQHDELAARLRAEVDAVLGERPATMGDLRNLPLLDAVVRETLRLYPPAYVMGREVAVPFEIGGYPIARGAQILMSPYVAHRDPRYFEDPDRFDPDRWLRPRAAPLPRFAYFPFGGGQRVCIGMHFAMMEIALVLATMVQQLALELASGFSLRLSPVVTMRPVDGVRVVVRRRCPPKAARRTAFSERAAAAPSELATRLP